MKYLAILVLLLAPAMAQDVVYLDPCIATDGFLLAHVDDAPKAFAAMTTMNLQARINWAVDCMGQKKASAAHLRAAGLTVYLAQSEIRNRLIEAAKKSEQQHLSDLATIDSLRSQAERASNDAAYYRFAAVTSTPAPAPVIHYESHPAPAYEPIDTYALPVPQKTCVATSTPLGQSVITGVNCY